MSPVVIVVIVLIVPVDFKVVQCRLSNLRKGCVALLKLRVNGPHSGERRITHIQYRQVYDCH